MAWLRTTISDGNPYKLFQAILDFLTGDPNTHGRDWQILSSTQRTDSGNVNQKTITGSFSDVSAGEWYYFPTTSVYDEEIKDGDTTLVEGDDYEIDRYVGKIKFTADHSSIDFSYTFKREEWLLYNTGEGGTDKVWVVLRPLIIDTEEEGWLKAIPYLSIDDGAKIITGNTDNALAFWNHEIELFIVSNKNRFIIVANSNGYYSFLYAGLAIRLDMPQDYPYPIVSTASHYAKDDLSDYWYHDVDQAGLYPLWRSYTFISIDNTFCSASGIQPCGIPTDCSSQTIRYPDGEPKMLFPIVLIPNTCDTPVIGSYEGVFWYPQTETDSMSEITADDGRVYWVFPDVSRNSWCHWHAILRE